MPINTREVIAVVSDLCRNENLRVSITSSIRGAAVAGGSTLFGGLLLGPVGLAIGGLVGVVLNATTGPNFRPVADILLNDLTTAQQAILVNRVNKIIRDIGIEDVIALTAISLTNQTVKTQLLRVVQEFIRSDLQLQLI